MMKRFRAAKVGFAYADFDNSSDTRLKKGAYTRTCDPNNQYIPYDVIDADFASQYPNAILENNICITTLSD